MHVRKAKYTEKGKLVTAKDVREFAGVLSREQRSTKGIITTTSTFAPGVEKEFENFIPTRIELKDRPKLLEWLRALSRQDSD